MNSYVIPDANKFRISFELNYLKKPFANKERHIHFKVAQNNYIYMERFDVRTDEGKNVTLEKIIGNQLVEKLSAKRIKWNEDSARWTFIDYNIRTFGEMEEEIEKGTNLDSLINMSPKRFR